MTFCIKRRDFITLLGGAAAWPLAARGQPVLPVIGYLYAGSAQGSAPLAAAFHKGLSETGFVEGQNVAVEYRWANNESGRLPDLAADLVRRQVAVITALANPAAIFAAKAATTTIPIIFSAGADAVQAGYVTNLNRPGGNVTGISSFNVELGAKRIGLLRDLVPVAARFAVLVNPNNPNAKSIATELQTAVTAIGGQIDVFNASNAQDIDSAFANLVQARYDALLVSPGTPFNERRERLTALAAQHALPTIYASREFAVAGGLVTYGAVLTDEFRQAGIYTGRILKGEKPADLPVMRAVKFEFVINLKTAKTLGLAVPPPLLAIADEVIE